MRIAIFTDTFFPDVNGVARTLKRLCDHLDDRSISYRLFAPKTSRNETTAAIHRSKSISAPFYPECKIALPNLWSIKKELEEFQPDLIHVATPLTIGATGLYLGKKLQIPLVASYHTNFDLYLRYYKLGFLSKFLWKYMRWFHQDYLQIYVPSSSTQEQLLDKGFTNIDILTHGVDCQQFKPTYHRDTVVNRYGITAPYILSYVGRLAAEKDLDVLFKASKLIPRQLNEHIHWLIVGEGPLSSELKVAAKMNMTFTGYLHGSDLAQVYAASDLFVFPSSTETFGNVVLEAMASATPVIGANAGGVAEIIEHEKTGLLCKPHDPEAFKEAIIRLLENEGKRKIMGENALKYARSQSWEHIFDELLISYQRNIEAYHETGKSSFLQVKTESNV